MTIFLSFPAESENELSRLTVINVCPLAEFHRLAAEIISASYFSGTDLWMIMFTGMDPFHDTRTPTPFLLKWQESWAPKANKSWSPKRKAWPFLQLVNVKKAKHKKINVKNF